VFAVTHWNTLLVIPPLIISEHELEAGLQAIDAALALTDSAIAKGGKGK
jgi:4-aminobutyrate aminotransferase-like enzyme